MKKNVAAGIVTCIVAGCLAPVALGAEVAWSPDGGCALCHTKEAATHEAIEAADGAAKAAGADAAASAVDTASTNAQDKAATASSDAAKGAEKQSADVVADAPLASVHAAFACTVCHSDEEALENVHDGVTADDKLPKRLRKAKIDEDVCLSCHGSYEDLAEKTADCTVLTDSAGTVVNPHDLPEGDDHAKLDCLDCHTAHKAQGVAETALNTCTGCHHAGVFECGTCH